VPGYPAFTAFFHLFGRDETALLLAQMAMDLCTCVLAGILAGLLLPRTASEQMRRRVQLAAIWLAALCPFLADYAAVNLTEVLATFLTAIALIAFVAAFIGNESLSWRLLIHGADDTLPAQRTKFSFLRNSWFMGGLAVGCGTMVRPEAPLILMAVGFFLAARWRKRVDWARLVRAGALTAVGFAIPLIPWTVRNAISLHEFQPLAPRYAQSPGETVPDGYYAWTNTWLERYRDINAAIWRMGEDQVSLANYPPTAFDNAEERDRVLALLNEYDKGSFNFSPAWNAKFAELARERTARNPWRTYIAVPFQRALTIWFTPRVEMLPFSGDLFPVREKFQSDREDLLVTILLGACAIVYVAMAIAGTARIFLEHFLSAPELWAVAVLIGFCVLRTTFITRVEAPEPRYVLECFPILYALGAFLWMRKTDRPEVLS
jgi:4-amino-4-deoxy-L-arabinose transferase-like glycosyltransferase